MIKLVAFCGSKGSGKSTSVDIFKSKVSEPIKDLAFADHLKHVCSRVFNVDMKYFLDPKLKEVELEVYPLLTVDKIEQVFKEFNISSFEFDAHVRPHVCKLFHTPRQLLQYIGTNLMHPLDSNIHIKTSMSSVDFSSLLLVSDLRFEQEFNYLRDSLKEEFLPVYVFNSKAESAASVDSHPSETGFFKFKDKCYVLDNNGSMQDLKANIDKLIEVANAKKD